MRSDRIQATRLRPVRLIALVLVLLLALTACAGADQTGGASGAVETPVAATTDTEAATESADGVAAEDVSGQIRFSWWGGQTRNEKTNAVIDLFEQQYPDVQVARETADFMPHWEKLTVQAAADDEPCAIQMQARYMTQFSERDVLLPLDDLVAEGTIDVSGIPETLLDTGRGPDGTLYMIPTGIYFAAMFYNADLMADAGLAEPTTDWTWDDFKQMLLDAQPNLPDGVHAAGLMGNNPVPFYAYVRGHGQQVFTEDGLGFDRQLLVDWFEYWKDLRQAGATVTPAMMVEEPEAFEQSYLANGAVMIDQAGANQLDTYQDVIDSTERGGTMKMQKLPNGPEGAGDELGANGISIGANCDNVPAAAAWIDFFTNDPEGAQIYASDNGVVTVDSLREAQAQDPDTPRGTKRLIELLDEIVALDPPQMIYPPNYAALLQGFERAYESVAFGRQSIEEAVDDFFAEAEQVVQG